MYGGKAPLGLAAWYAKYFPGSTPGLAMYAQPWVWLAHTESPPGVTPEDAITQSLPLANEFTFEPSVVVLDMFAVLFRRCCTNAGQLKPSPMDARSSTCPNISPTVTPEALAAFAASCTSAVAFAPNFNRSRVIKKFLVPHRAWVSTFVALDAFGCSSRLSV